MQRRRSHVCLPLPIPITDIREANTANNQTLLNGSATKPSACTVCLKSIFRGNTPENQESISPARVRGNTLSLILERGHGFRGTVSVASPRKMWNLSPICWSGLPELRSDRLCRGGLGSLISRSTRLEWRWAKGRESHGLISPLRTLYVGGLVFMFVKNVNWRTCYNKNAGYIMTVLRPFAYWQSKCTGELTGTWWGSRDLAKWRIHYTVTRYFVLHDWFHNVCGWSPDWVRSNLIQKTLFRDWRPLLSAVSCYTLFTHHSPNYLTLIPYYPLSIIPFDPYPLILLAFPTILSPAGHANTILAASIFIF